MAKVSISKPLLHHEKECYGRLSAREKRLICVTSGNSYLGFHLVKELLFHGYIVRVIVENEVDFEELKEKINDDEELNAIESVVMAKMDDLSSLCDAFRGSHAVFHTSSFIDPHGISGYTMEAAKNVIEACGRASYVKRCVFTSSLLAAIWRGDINVDGIVDESCWSNEEFCRENKLWLALGKTMAEKVAWNMAGELKVKLVTLCPALLIDPLCPNDLYKHPYVPYLKGSEKMLQQGTFATADVKKVAEAHRHVYEALDYGANGRYLCFDTVNKAFNREIDQETENNLNNSKLAKLIFDQTFRHFSCNA